MKNTLFHQRRFQENRKKRSINRLPPKIQTQALFKTYELKEILQGKGRFYLDADILDMVWSKNSTYLQISLARLQPGKFYKTHNAFKGIKKN